MAKSTRGRGGAGSRKDGGIFIESSQFKELLSSMVDRGATENPFDAATKVMVAARLPIGVLCRLDALAERLKENRTEALCRLVHAGWDQLMKEIKPEVRKVLLDIEERKAKALIDEINRK